MVSLKKPAVVLLSGGLDSSTVVACAQRDGFEVYAMSFNYGQRHQVELQHARRVAQKSGVRDHVVVNFDLRPIGGSSLTSSAQVPKHRSVDEMGQGIPSTYVPARNTIFLSFALAWAEVLHSHDIYLGVNALDYSGYPDCRPEYISAYETMANLATREGVEGREALKLHTPLMRLTKAGIIRLGTELGVDYADTFSCYDPDGAGRPCGSCDACLLRAKGFEEAGLPDPLLLLWARA
jgi:7-cyano-7-deazaguanine synthase